VLCFVATDRLLSQIVLLSQAPVDGIANQRLIDSRALRVRADGTRLRHS
jgi:hypothetical protein